MVDRLEELLAMVENEDENGEEEREDGPALVDRTVPAAPAEDSGENALVGSEWRDVLADIDGEGPERAAGEAARDGSLPGGELEAGTVWTLGAGGVPAAEAPRRALEERTGRAAGTVPEDGTAFQTRLDAGYGGEAARIVRYEDESGLEGLYRQTVRASRPAAPQAQPVEQAGRTVRAEEPGRAAALTVDELDRAVRRDSRRYDGGMTIF